MADELVGAGELASWLRISTRRLSQLVHEEVITKESRGKYRLKACVQAFCEFKDSILLKKGTGSELNTEKLLTVRLERRRKELEFAELEGSLVMVKHHEEVLAEAFALVRKNIRNLPGSLAPRLAGLDDPRDIERILSPALDDALRSIVVAGRELTDDELPDDVPGRKHLQKAGVRTVSGLMSIEDLTALGGIGKGTAAKIHTWLEARG